VTTAEVAASPTASALRPDCMPRRQPTGGHPPMKQSHRVPLVVALRDKWSVWPASCRPTIEGYELSARGLGLRSCLAIALLLVVPIQACATKSSISQVLTDPGRYRDKDVKVVGNVTESIGLLGYGFFKLDDGTGALWVFSRKGLPRQGAQVVVRGSVKDIAVFNTLVTTAEGRRLIPEALARALRGGVLMIEDDRSGQ
jgi:hypothetical protein